MKLGDESKITSVKLFSVFFSKALAFFFFFRIDCMLYRSANKCPIIQLFPPYLKYHSEMLLEKNMIRGLKKMESKIIYLIQSFSTVIR